jgi:hypothetical protein
MRLVLLGCDSEALELLKSAHLRQKPQITAFCRVEYHEDLAKLGGDVHGWDHWGSAMNLADVAVFVVASQPPPIEQLRFLAQSGQPILVTHPAYSMIDGFELQMIQSDTLASIQPHFSGINHPLLDLLGQWQTAPDVSPIGALQQFAVRRPLASDSRQSVLDTFARDALILRRLMGRVDRVNAIGVESLDQDDWSHLSVQMTKDPGLVGRWTMVPSLAGQTARLEVIGQRGTATAELGEDPREWSLELTSPTARSIALPVWGGTTELLDRFSGPQPHPLTSRDWEDACRAVELVDAVEQSCRRGKTICLTNEQPSQESTFKGVMAAGGCMLLLGLLGFMFLLQAMHIMRPGISEWAGWSTIWRLLFITLFGFLALQLLRLVFRR